MQKTRIKALWLLLCPAIALAQVEANPSIDAGAIREPMEIGRYALGQGGLSDRPIFDSHVDAIRSLHVKLIRLFVQEYFDLYPKRGVYHWDTLDKAVETIPETGAKPLMSICLKPRLPTSYAEWEELIYQMVRHYNVQEKACIRYWDVFNEPDIGEDGGCPSRFTAESYARYYAHTAAGAAPYVLVHHRSAARQPPDAMRPRSGAEPRTWRILRAHSRP